MGFPDACLVWSQIVVYLGGSALCGAALVLFLESGNFFWLWIFPGLFLLCSLCYRISYKRHARCYLCKEVLTGNAVDMRIHRMECANSHASFLEGLPKADENSKCPKCTQILVLWPTSHEPKEFRCSNTACPIGVNEDTKQKINNTGTNCFACFVCDVFMCSMCASLQTSEETHLNIQNLAMQACEDRARARPSAAANEDVEASLIGQTDPPPTYESILAKNNDEETVSPQA